MRKCFLLAGQYDVITGRRILRIQIGGESNEQIAAGKMERAEVSGGHLRYYPAENGRSVSLTKQSLAIR